MAPWHRGAFTAIITFLLSILSIISSVTSAEVHTGLNDSTVVFFGGNIRAELGTDSAIAPPAIPDYLPLKNPVAISLSKELHAFSILLANDSTIFTAGDNNLCQLGRETANYQFLPMLTPTVPVYAVTKVYAGSQHAFLLSETGEAYGWGRADSGQLAMGPVGGVDHECIPVGIPLLGAVTDVAIGAARTLFIVDNALVGAGSNAYSSLGLGDDVVEVVYPTYIPLPDGVVPAKIRTSNAMASVLISADGDLYVTGMFNGIRFHGFTKVPTPEPMRELEIYESILAVSVTGRLYGMGPNNAYELFLGDNIPRHALAFTGLTNVSSVGMGAHYSFAVIADEAGDLQLWGVGLAISDRLGSFRPSNDPALLYQRTPLRVDTPGGPIGRYYEFATGQTSTALIHSPQPLQIPAGRQSCGPGFYVYVNRCVRVPPGFVQPKDGNIPWEQVKWCGVGLYQPFVGATRCLEASPDDCGPGSLFLPFDDRPHAAECLQLTFSDLDFSCPISFGAPFYLSRFESVTFNQGQTIVDFIDGAAIIVMVLDSPIAQAGTYELQFHRRSDPDRHQPFQVELDTAVWFSNITVFSINGPNVEAYVPAKMCPRTMVGFFGSTVTIFDSLTTVPSMPYEVACQYEAEPITAAHVAQLDLTLTGLPPTLSPADSMSTLTLCIESGLLDFEQGLHVYLESPWAVLIQSGAAQYKAPVDLVNGGLCANITLFFTNLAGADPTDSSAVGPNLFVLDGDSVTFTAVFDTIPCYTVTLSVGPTHDRGAASAVLEAMEGAAAVVFALSPLLVIQAVLLAGLAGMGVTVYGIRMQKLKEQARRNLILI
ncbi:Regulator of chromosome condensation (RCC1) repeat [Carpediemonas membranifera]|uniref:Regulator of chromosome condensation (RCC1) repeat n=1 Tax=Carpediemonas membranifera TaxID=201153 RepID=A0A8J6C0I6_9EUKA|nr:Regulator of chromosome condensation (RCC1) repeat [Carpediemonas membranifera]|eukprot:KAG9396621.1 Regulator of chromosome condensation (RCC1) repeat [Carpediemonas membranifera]